MAVRLGYIKIWRSDDDDEEKRQRLALRKAGVERSRIYVDTCSDLRDETPALDAVLKALRPGDTFVVVSYGRLGRSVQHLVRVIDAANQEGIEVVVLEGMALGTASDSIGPIEVDPPTARGIFRALARFDSELRSIRTRDGLETARRFGRSPGRRPALSASQVRYAQQVLQAREVDPAQLCVELGVTPTTLRKYMSALGELRDVARNILAQENPKPAEGPPSQAPSAKAGRRGQKR